MTTTKLFSHSSPVFPVKDVIETANYYKKYLGFDITFTYGDPPYYSVVIREDIGIHFYKVDSSISIQSNQLVIFVYDVDALYHEFQQKGVKDMTNQHPEPRPDLTTTLSQRPAQVHSY